MDLSTGERGRVKGESRDEKIVMVKLIVQKEREKVGIKIKKHNNITKKQTKNKTNKQTKNKKTHQVQEQ
jgi:hypothetical protein